MTDVEARAKRAVVRPAKRAWRSIRTVLPLRESEPFTVGVRRWLRGAGLFPKLKDPAECPVCGTVVETFLPSGVKRVVPDRMCPTCTSQERHRAVWLYFQERTDLFTGPKRLLDVAPDRAFGPRLAALPNISYISADLASPKAMVRLDLTDIPHPDASFDVIYVSHVLEHIPDDRHAMREVYRVLRPGGWAVLLVPIFGATTREDPTVVDPAERERLFGQDNHVRMYGHDGEYERRLREAGFDVTADRFVADLDPALVRRYRLQTDEIIHLCSKRDAPAAV